MGRLVVVVDDDVDPSNLADVMWAITTRCEPAEQIDIVRNAWSSALDPRIPAEAQARAASPRIPRRSSRPCGRSAGRTSFRRPRRSPPTRPARSRRNGAARSPGARRRPPRASPLASAASGASSCDFLAAALLLAEIHVDLHPGGERAGLRELHHDLHRIDIGAVVRSARAQPRRLDQRRDRHHRAGEFLVGKRRGAHRRRLPNLDFRDVALIQFGAHVQRRKIGDRAAAAAAPRAPQARPD